MIVKTKHPEVSGLESDFYDISNENRFLTPLKGHVVIHQTQKQSIIG